jgi:hypothetical protein
VTKSARRLVVVSTVIILVLTYSGCGHGGVKEFTPLPVTLSIDGNGYCQQNGGFDPINIKNGQAVIYSSATNNFTIMFRKPSFGSVSTGSPFPDASGNYPLQIQATGSAFTTLGSALSGAEQFWISIGVTSLEGFPYTSTMTIDGKVCNVKPNTGVHVDP